MKTEQTFTLGKWSTDFGLIRLEDQLTICSDDIGTNREWQPVTIHDGDGPAEVVALCHPYNSNLIAAAPCLYEACRKGLAVAEAHALDCNPHHDLKPGDSADYDAAMVMVGVFKAALDKATGSKP